MLEVEVKKQLKDAELQAKKTRLRIWTNYVPPATNSKAIHDQNFAGKVDIIRWSCKWSFIFLLLKVICICLAFCRWLRL